MRRSLLASAMSLVLLVSAFVPVASARPLAGAALAQSRVHVVREGAGVHVTFSDEMNCTGRRTFWYSVASGRVNYPDYVLQAIGWYELDYYTSSYCGIAQAEGQPRLLHNCYNLDGHIYTSEYDTSHSDYSVFHCTAQLYDLWGPVDYHTDCHAGYTLSAANFVGSDVAFVDSNCTTL